MVLKNPNKYEKGKTIVYFVRHGERIHVPNDHGIGLKIPGPALTAKGKKQAKEVAKKFSKMKDEVDVIYTSGMTRAIETANEISKVIKKKPIKINALSEFNHTLWERKLHTKKFWVDYLKHKKSIKIFNKILEKNKGKVIVCVLHGNVIKGLIFRKLGMSLKKTGKFHHKNCYISIARYNGKKLDHVCCYNSGSIEHGDY